MAHRSPQWAHNSGSTFLLDAFVALDLKRAHLQTTQLLPNHYGNRGDLCSSESQVQGADHTREFHQEDEMNAGI